MLWGKIRLERRLENKRLLSGIPILNGWSRKASLKRQPLRKDVKTSDQATVTWRKSTVGRENTI